MDSRLGRRLADLLGRVRDHYVAQLLEEYAQALSSGAEVEAEPEVRDRAGKVVREGALRLPFRYDLSIRGGGGARGGAAPRRVAIDTMLSFDPMFVRRDDHIAVRIASFQWNAALVLAVGAQNTPNWEPLRLWFLEWFQPRQGDVSPELRCALHDMTGPEKTPEGWRFRVDFGSAPIEAFAAMLDAFARTGCTEIAIGQAPAPISR